MRRVGISYLLALGAACGGDPAVDSDTDPADTEISADAGESATSAATDTTDTDATGDGDATSTSTGDGDGDGTSTSTGDGDGDGDGDGVIPGDPCVAPPALSELDASALSALQSDIDAALAASPVGSVDQSVKIVDFETGQIVYERNPDQRQKPASNTKLVITAASMEVLGRDHRLTTTAFADTTPDASGNVANLDVVGAHDFTADDEFYADISFPFDQLARRLYDAGLRQVTGSLTLHGEWLVNGASLGTYSASAHRAAAASMLATALSDAGIVAPSPTTAADFTAPAGSISIAAWQSPPLEVGNVPVNVRSHNEMADILSRHLGWSLSGDSSYAAGEVEMLDFLTSIGIDVTGVNFDDGSGLSHDNRVAAGQLITLFDTMLRSDLAAAWVRTFSIAGVRGTLGSRQTGPDTWGRSWGKTGTLYDTITLSGVLFHRHDARRYLYSVLFNNDYVALDSGGSRARADDVIRALAEDRRGVTPPGTPTFELARADGPGIAQLEWSAVSGADGYVAYFSPDGWAWSRDDACFVTTTSFRPGDLTEDAPMYWRVAAWSDTDDESWPSDVLSVRADTGLSRVLVVDGNDRWQADPAVENPRGVAHDFLVPAVEALGTRSVDSVANERIADGSVALGDYDLVVWSLGEESTMHDSFDANEQAEVLDYLDAGGAVIASGAEIAWDLGASGDAGDVMFLADAFATTYAGDDALTYTVEAAGLPTASFFTPGAMDVALPDVLTPTAAGVQFLSYVGGAGGTAAVVQTSPRATALVGFPLESVDNVPDRRAIMDALLAALGL